MNLRPICLSMLFRKFRNRWLHPGALVRKNDAQENLGGGAATCLPPAAIPDMTATNHGMTEKRDTAITFAPSFMNAIFAQQRDRGEAFFVHLVGRNDFGINLPQRTPAADFRSGFLLLTPAADPECSSGQKVCNRFFALLVSNCAGAPVCMQARGQPPRAVEKIKNDCF